MIKIAADELSDSRLIDEWLIISALSWIKARKSPEGFNHSQSNILNSRSFRYCIFFHCTSGSCAFSRKRNCMKYIKLQCFWWLKQQHSSRAIKQTWHLKMVAMASHFFSQNPPAVPGKPPPCSWKPSQVQTCKLQHLGGISWEKQLSFVYCADPGVVLGGSKQLCGGPHAAFLRSEKQNELWVSRTHSIPIQVLTELSCSLYCRSKCHSSCLQQQMGFVCFLLT